MNENLKNIVSKLFRAYRLYNEYEYDYEYDDNEFQSSFELTGYITTMDNLTDKFILRFQSSFELTGYITQQI